LQQDDEKQLLLLLLLMEGVKNAKIKFARLKFAAKTRSKMQGVENAKLENKTPKMQDRKMREKQTRGYACG